MTTLELEMTGWTGTDAVVRVLRRLRGCTDVGELFALASEAARAELAFDRAVILSVDGSELTARDCGALADPQSDVLRRRVLARPVALHARTPEAVALGRGTAASEPSVLAAALDLVAPCFAAIAPAGAPLALLVVDRIGPDGAEDHRSVDAFAAVIGVALEQAVLRMRNAHIAAELRHLVTSADALLGELQDAPLTLPSTGGAGPALTWSGPERERGSLFSDREVEILDRLVAGRSNREIAEELVLAPDTVKGHVARILRKLGAANRVEAVALYLAMAGGGR